MIAHPQQNSSHGTYVNDRPCTGSVIGESSLSNGGPRPLQGGLTPPIGREHPPIGGANPLPRAGLPPIGGTPPPLAASQAGKSTKWEGLSTKLAAGLRSVARNYKATRLLTRPGQSTKSSAKDSILRTVKLQYTSQQPLLLRGCRCRSAKVLGQRPIRIRLRCAGGIHPVLAWILTQRRSAIIQQMVASRQCLVRQPQKPII